MVNAVSVTTTAWRLYTPADGLSVCSATIIYRPIVISYLHPCDPGDLDDPFRSASGASDVRIGQPTCNGWW